MAEHLVAAAERARDPLFVSQCNWQALRQRMPLPWPTPADIPPSPKAGYRSHYVYLGCDDLDEPAQWSTLEPFDLALRLIDFSPLRPQLAQLLGWTSARGQVPFDPVSLFLLVGWQVTNGWNRSQALRHLRQPRYADYAQRFGFHDRVYPSEGGMRYFLTTLGRNSQAHGEIITITDDEQQLVAVAVQRLNHLLAQSLSLIRQTDLLSPQVWSQALICPDGMLHPAASRLDCTAVSATCYQPTSPAKPRPCPARDKERQGCDCATLACQAACRHAPSRDPEARFVWYSGSNQPQNSPNRPVDPSQAVRSKGKGVYGYRSLPLQLVDPARHFSLVLLDDFRPANQHEEIPVAALLKQLPTFYPDLQVDAVVGDAGFGYDCVLSTIYRDLHARRVVDLRRHETDQNKALWSVRHYDDTGRPICSFGYAYTANGFDYQRQRHKWFCQQACRQGAQPVIPLPAGVTPDPCPYASQEHYPHGHLINIAERFSDGSIRLVRDLPFQSPAWERLYHQARNAVEGRNAACLRWNLKRLPVFGLLRARALDFLTDLWLNLTTLTRLVAEATAACRSP